MALPKTPETRTAAQIAEDDQFAAQTDVTVQPELWLRGEKVPDGQVVVVNGTTFDLRQYTMTKRSFPNRKTENDAKSDYDEYRKMGASREKAWRLCYSSAP